MKSRRAGVSKAANLGVTLPGLSSVVLACTLLIARAQARPRHHVPSGGEPGQINTHLRDDDFSRTAAYAWNRLQTLEFRFGGAQALSNLGTDSFDGRVFAIDRSELLGNQEPLMRAKMPWHGPFQFRQLFTHPPLGQVGQSNSPWRDGTPG